MESACGVVDAFDGGPNIPEGHVPPVEVSSVNEALLAGESLGGGPAFNCASIVAQPANNSGISGPAIDASRRIKTLYVNVASVWVHTGTTGALEIREKEL